MIDFLQGANLMNSIGSFAAPAASGLGSMATAFMPTIANAATSFAPATASFAHGNLLSNIGVADGLSIGNAGIFRDSPLAIGAGSMEKSLGLQGYPDVAAAYGVTGNPVPDNLKMQLDAMNSPAGALSVGEGVGAGKGAAKASKGFLGMNPQQQAFWEFMAGDVIAPLAKQIAAGQIEEEKDDEGHVIGYKYNDFGRALAALGDLSSSFTLGSQAFNKLASLKAPGGSTASTPRNPSGGGEKTPKTPKKKQAGDDLSFRSYGALPFRQA